MLYFLKYLDNIGYNRIFNYLNENYKFLPKILHTDFETAFQKAVNENKYLKDITYNSHCFFHFGQMIRAKLKKLGLCKKKLHKMDIEIIRNIEILCFLETDKIKDFKKIILENLSKEDKYKSFINYLKDYIFKMNPAQYNYSKLIEYSKERNQTKFIEKI